MTQYPSLRNKTKVEGHGDPTLNSETSINKAKTFRINTQKTNEVRKIDPLSSREPYSILKSYSNKNLNNAKMTAVQRTSTFANSINFDANQSNM